MAIMYVFNAINSALRDRTRLWMVPFVWLEAKTGVDHVKLSAGCLLAALAFIIASGRMVMLVSNLLGFAYPTYASIEWMVKDDRQRETSPPPTPLPVLSGQSGRYAPISQATRWLTYWITFAAVLMVQQLCGDILRFIPFYFLVKIAFFVWCALPMEANGAAFVHRYVVRDHLKHFFD
ncbi:receptor expression-enhancing protein 5-like [Melanaphis sacchari]|uniref:receptor expression-enhancing protein 5-like n=1 Tax=Melanaphis sacchari TaxID=742174 RepID=UPI000DC1343F|nr:receptor expression-enhancing protein 5-like [Melanaphis sacchari]